jgi:predicted RNase H-related nuclease YkuK (DUF458 family)
MAVLNKWKRLSDKKTIELIPYLENWIRENPINKIYIGCDSHNSPGKTTFATVIVLHYSTGGGHVLYSREAFPLIKDRHARLWREVEFSVSTAVLLMENGLEKPDYIDVDLNPDPKYQSNSLLRSALGLIESIGIIPRYKTKSPWSISIADKACR